VDMHSGKFKKMDTLTRKGGYLGSECWILYTGLVDTLDRNMQLGRNENRPESSDGAFSIATIINTDIRI
jgi:hypothetical protein